MYNVAIDGEIIFSNNRQWSGCYICGRLNTYTFTHGCHESCFTGRLSYIQDTKKNKKTMKKTEYKGKSKNNKRTSLKQQYLKQRAGLCILVIVGIILSLSLCFAVLECRRMDAQLTDNIIELQEEYNKQKKDNDVREQEFETYYSIDELCELAADLGLQRPWDTEIDTYRYN